MKSRFAGLLIVFILLLGTAVFASCSRKEKNTDKTGKEYQIFYIDSKSYGIVSEAYVPLSLTKEDLVKELLEVLQKEPPVRLASLLRDPVRPNPARRQLGYGHQSADPPVWHESR